jgi:CheY-like chemotaxis protein
MNEYEARILFVDDQEDMVTTIVDALAGNNWRFDTYGDVESATKAINIAHSEGWDYDAAILDFRLPRFPGDLDQPVDETLCRMVRRGTLIWHISGFFSQAEVQEHVRTCHSADEQIAMIEKSEGLTEQLEDQIKQALATRRIKVSLAALWSDPNESGYSRRYRPEPAAASTTNLFGRLCGDIQRFWPDLTPAFQDELRESFEITMHAAKDQVISVYPK